MRSDVAAEYERWRKQLGEEDPYAGPNTVGLEEVFRAHFLLVDYFLGEREGLGGVGVKYPDLLHSALARQSAGYGGVERWTTPFEIVATLFYGYEPRVF